MVPRDSLPSQQHTYPTLLPWCIETQTLSARQARHKHRKRRKVSATDLVLTSYWSFSTKLIRTVFSQRHRFASKATQGHLQPGLDETHLPHMTHGSMRKLLTPSSSSLRCWKNFLLNPQRIIVKDTPILFSRQILPARGLAQVRPEPLSELWFTPSSPVRSPADDLPGGSPQGGNGKDHKPPDERTLKLGKSVQSLTQRTQDIYVTDTVRQLYGLSPRSSQTSSQRRSHQKSCPHQSPCTSSPLLTRTFPPSKGRLLIKLHFGPPL